MKIAVMFDECGDETFVECDDDVTREEVLAHYPECVFRHWQEPTDYGSRFADMDADDTWDLW